MPLSKKGIDIRETTGHLMFRALLQDTAGALVVSGTTNLYLYELQSDGTLLSYDWSSNTFKSIALTTETQGMTHRTGNNGTTNTGLWTFALNTLTGFTVGGIYLARVKNTGANPTDQVREFQFGGAESDFLAPTTAGRFSADATAINAVSTSQVVSVDAYIGTSQPAAGDSLINQVPGDYPPGSAGAALGRIGVANLTVVSPIATNAFLTLTQGDDYAAADNRELRWVNVSGTWPDLTGAAIMLVVNDGTMSSAGTVVTPSGPNQQVQAHPSHAETGLLTPGQFDYQVKATLNTGRVVTLVQGYCKVVDNEAV